MNTHWVEAMKRLFGKDFAGRDFPAFPDDSFLVSYPRSGSTWLRFLIGNLICKDCPVTFHNVEKIIPDIHVNSSRFIASIPRPRLIKSHEYYDPRYGKMVYLVRDPRDVVLSYYRYYRKIRRFPEGYPMEKYIAAFLTGQLQSWGSWAQNVTSWLAVREGKPGFLLLRYEDLREDPVCELLRVCDFLEIQCTSDELIRAINLSSADRMRGLEMTQGDEWVTTRGTRKDVPFIGAATSGLWKTELGIDSLVAIEFAWGTLMTSLGYKLGTLVHRGENRRQTGAGRGAVP